MLDRVANALRNPIVIPRYLDQRRKLLQVRHRQRHNRRIFSVDMVRSSGFFAQLTWCAYIFSYCEERQLIPHVTSANPLYTDPARGPDCLAYFFANPQQAFIDANVVSRATIRRVQELGLPTWCIAQMTIERAAALTQRYLPVRQEIVDAVDQFVAQHLGDAVVAGVHFRGTDKSSEAPPVTPERCVAVVRRILDDHPEVTALFVASDVGSFIEYIRSTIRTVPIYSCDDARSEGRIPIHRAALDGDRYRRGREALLNCLLLARCSVLVRTASALSGWASVFNPQLPVVMLNQPYPECLWFPDRAVRGRSSECSELICELGTLETPSPSPTIALRAQSI